MGGLISPVVQVFGLLDEVVAVACSRADVLLPAACAVSGRVPWWGIWCSLEGDVSSDTRALWRAIMSIAEEEDMHGRASGACSTGGKTQTGEP